MSSSDTTLRERFWELPLDSLNAMEWERLCDGCGRCCLKKLEDPDSGEIAWTRVVCRYFHEPTSQCQCYTERSVKVPDCVDVKSMDIEKAGWMPPTCAYRLRYHNKPLYDWHPLVAGNRNLMEEAGISIAGKVLSEDHVHPDGYEEHLIRWIEL